MTRASGSASPTVRRSAWGAARADGSGARAAGVGGGASGAAAAGRADWRWLLLWAALGTAIGWLLLKRVGRRPLHPALRALYCGWGVVLAADVLARTAERLEQISAQLNQARGTLQAMGDPAALAAQAEELEDALARRRLEYDALATAMDALTQANAQLQERFSPELNRLTGQYMARLTGDKYPAVSFTRELEGLVRAGGDVLPRSSLYLSRGTADQLYLALRLAVLHNLYFYNELMDRIRKALDNGTFADFRARYSGRLEERV